MLIDLSWVDMSNPVAIWWIIMTSISFINMLVWFWIRFYKFQGSNFLSIFKFRKKVDSIIWLSFLYTFICAFRAIFPRADVQRIVLFDGWLSSVFVGRTVATVAELAFVSQWSLVLVAAGIGTHSLWARNWGYILVPMIFVAECFSWYAVISTHYLGNVLEESIWGISYLGIGIALVQIWFKIKGPLRLATGFAICGSVLYVLFMFFVDVPMYYSRLAQNILNSKEYLNFIDGVSDLQSRWVVTRDIAEWRTEIPWMTLYFSFAVWVSLLLNFVSLNTSDWKSYLRK